MVGMVINRDGKREREKSLELSVSSLITSQSIKREERRGKGNWELEARRRGLREQYSSDFVSPICDEFSCGV